MTKQSKRNQLTPERSHAADVKPQSEFCRVPDVQRIFGLKRGVVYRLLNEGRIRSVSLSTPGHAKGCRLINVASVRAFLASLEKLT